MFLSKISDRRCLIIDTLRLVDSRYGIYTHQGEAVNSHPGRQTDSVFENIHAIARQLRFAEACSTSYFGNLKASWRVLNYLFSTTGDRLILTLTAYRLFVAWRLPNLYRTTNTALLCPVMHISRTPHLPRTAVLVDVEK